MIKFFFNIVLALYGFSLFAQDNKHTVGLKSGIGFFNIYSANKEKSIVFNDTKYRSVFVSFLNYEYRLNSLFSIVTGCGFIQKGYKEELKITNENASVDIIDFDYKFNYLSIPVILNIQKGKRFKLFTEIGIVPSYLINSRYYHSASQIIPATTDEIKNVAKFDVVGEVGIGVTCHINEKIKIGLGGYYNLSFLTISTKDYWSGFDLKHFGFY